MSNLHKKTSAERRAFRREHIILPAVIYIRDKGKKIGWYRAAKILNISFSGVCLQIDKNNVQGLLSESKTATDDFEILFSFTDTGLPVSFRCAAQRVEEKSGEYLIGASFSQTDPGSHSIMQRYLM
ncbi:PilZ domain-containing protein [Desulfovibrio sp. X2]|uniref:PilZ domain-containing protein n=1 Tax=Desulfovibrio sp. X2 TaxID=941449 RepID=UPI001F18585E|nr:PilZ domain-containing protein [Desulfovibrio sp. X2]